MAEQHELDPETMARLVDSSTWQAYMRDFLLPNWKMACARYDGARQDHGYWQAWKLAWKYCIETPYEKAGRHSPLELRWNLESEPVAQSAAEAQPPEAPPPVRPLRRTTFPV